MRLRRLAAYYPTVLGTLGWALGMHRSLGLPIMLRGFLFVAEDIASWFDVFDSYCVIWGMGL